MEKTARQMSHYGVLVSSEVPTTGVFSIHPLDHLFDDLNDAVDLCFEEHKKTCHKRYHDTCYYTDGSQTEIIGFKKIKGGKRRGQWVPDPLAEYSGILHEGIFQVVASSYRIRGALCSPCYPGQVDADTVGEWLAYSVPPDVVGDSNPELKARIFKEGEEK